MSATYSYTYTHTKKKKELCTPRKENKQTTGVVYVEKPGNLVYPEKKKKDGFCFLSLFVAAECVEAKGTKKGEKKSDAHTEK